MTSNEVAARRAAQAHLKATWDARDRRLLSEAATAVRRATATSETAETDRLVADLRRRGMSEWNLTPAGKELRRLLALRAEFAREAGLPRRHRDEGGAGMRRTGAYGQPAGEKHAFRAATDDPGKFIGVAAVFNSRTTIGNPRTWGWWEEIAPGAFDSALARADDVRFLIDHDPRLLLARTATGTLRLETDKRGLKVDADLPNTTPARDAVELLKRGDLNQMSFGFMRPTVEWSELDDGTELARIVDIGLLFDVSVVTFPAYKDTTAASA